MTDEQAQAFTAWLEKVRNFGISVWRDAGFGEGWGELVLAANWLWREKSRRLAYSDLDRPHLLTFEAIEADGDGWYVTANGDRFSVQILSGEQNEIVDQWRQVRPDPQWTWSLRTLLGDVPGEEPTP